MPSDCVGRLGYASRGPAAAPGAADPITRLASAGRDEEGGPDTRWGNPWRIWREPDGLWHLAYGACNGGIVAFRRRDYAASEAMRLYREWIIGRGVDYTPLAGWSLACWCPLPEAGGVDWCHAAVLLELANADTGSGSRRTSGCLAARSA